MVKSYLKYEHSKTFGLITSGSSNVVWAADEDAPLASARQTGAGRAIVGADEDVLCWDVKKGELLNRWRDRECKSEVTTIANSSADLDVYAVGYADGTIKIWDSRTATIVISFNGHRSGITTLVFDKLGVRLASGSQDTDIIVWDLVAEVGLYKLRGHKNQITGLHFLQSPGTYTNGTGTNGDAENGTGLTNGYGHAADDSPGFLLSIGKDALIKLWDLSSQHCFETHVAQSNGECWALGVSPDNDGCITAGNDGELRVWSLDVHGLNQAASHEGDGPQRKCLKERGTLHRQSKDKAIGVKFHPRGEYIAAHGSDKAVEVWKIRSEAEIVKTLARKRKRRREKLEKAGQDVNMDAIDTKGTDVPENIAMADIADVIVLHTIIRTSGKVRSIDWAEVKKSRRLRLLVSSTNNALEIFVISTKKKEEKEKKSKSEDMYERTFSVEMHGHRTDVRSLALSSDDRMLASASNGSLKIWNIRTHNCIRTLECGYALCSCFLPGDKVVVVGNRKGELELFDIASSTLIDTVQAHEGPIWTLNVHPNGRSLVTGSGDKSAKFWNFQVVQEQIPGTERTMPRLKLIHTRTLKVSDDILSLRYSPDERLLAVSLLDNTVKVFFVDSLKLFLNLYGHKLPVLNMDISFDSKLIVTCSADKNVRVWGLDFGDCHKAFFGHQDSVMQVAFVPHNQDGNGHHFFSASKDKMLKYWDGDKFEQIQRLDGHHGEIWAMAVSRTGDFVVSASHDKSIRVWEQTDEQIFLEEEREREMEELFDQTLTTSLEQEEPADGEKSEVAPASKQTTETLIAGERLAEALEIGVEDHEAIQAAKAAGTAPPQRNPVFLAFGDISAEQHVFNVVQKIQAAALQDALLILPFDKVTALFLFIQIWAERQWNLPLTCRILFFMLKTHHRQIVASKTMRPMLDGIRGTLRKGLQQHKDEMGFNLAALRFVGRRVKDMGTKEYVDEEIWVEEEREEAKGRKKRAFVSIA